MMDENLGEEINNRWGKKGGKEFHVKINVRIVCFLSNYIKNMRFVVCGVTNRAGSKGICVPQQGCLMY